MKEEYNKIIRSSISEGGFALTEEDLTKTTKVNHQDGETSIIKNGSVVLAAITSCTNTSNPNVLITAGLVAKKAVERGLMKQPYVKTSLTPGSRVVTDYLEESGLLTYLEKLGFHIAGYGCATCIGNSGPLPQEVNDAVSENDLVVAGVLSGNRNFEGRIHPQIKANYLASPPLVIAYAIAGTVDIDLFKEPIGFDQFNKPVYLRELWPSSQEIQKILSYAVSPELFQKRYQNVTSSNEEWNSIQVSEGDLYDWDEKSTYIQEPPFLKEMTEQPSNIVNIEGARTLAMLGHSVTTDHLSPSGAIKADSASGLFLQQKGVGINDFNSYPSRRGNHEVMVRAALANLRIRNQLVPGYEGGMTKYFPTGEILSMYDASMKYREDRTPLFILAGKEYGTGSSRDWAAKGPYLLGVKVVLAESFERIHRSNLVGMGILPLQFLEGQNVRSLGITGDESFETIGLNDSIKPGKTIKIKAIKPDKSSFEFDVKLRLDNVVEIEYYRNSGIMQSVVRRMVKSKSLLK